MHLEIITLSKMTQKASIFLSQIFLGYVSERQIHIFSLTRVSQLLRYIYIYVGVNVGVGYKVRKGTVKIEVLGRQ